MDSIPGCIECPHCHISIPEHTFSLHEQHCINSIYCKICLTRYPKEQHETHIQKCQLNQQNLHFQCYVCKQHILNIYEKEHMDSHLIEVETEQCANAQIQKPDLQNENPNSYMRNRTTRENLVIDRSSDTMRDTEIDLNFGQEQEYGWQGEQSQNCPICGVNMKMAELNDHIEAHQIQEGERGNSQCYGARRAKGKPFLQERSAPQIVQDQRVPSQALGFPLQMIQNIQGYMHHQHEESKSQSHSQHGSSQTIICEVCNKNVRLADLEMHSVQHESEKNTCRNCGKQYPLYQNSEFQNHIRSCNPRPVQQQQQINEQIRSTKQQQGQEFRNRVQQYANVDRVNARIYNEYRGQNDFLPNFNQNQFANLGNEQSQYFDIGDNYEELLKLDEDQYSVGKGLTPQQIVEKCVVSTTWKESMGEETCSICYCQIEVGEEIRKLWCLHVFHQVCIDDWLSRSKKCPIDNKTWE